MNTNPTIWELFLGFWGLEPERPEDEAGGLYEPGG